MELAFSESLARLITAASLGALIGLEREPAHRGAGLRTHAVVALGAALFTLAGAYGFGDITRPGQFDPSRVAAQVAAGVGFIGAGAILRQGDSVSGVTTAATVWLAAAVGVTAAAGGYATAVTATVVAVVSIVLFRRAKPQLRRLQNGRTVVEIGYDRGHGTIVPVLRFLADHGAHIDRLEVQDDCPNPDQPGLRNVRMEVTLARRATLDGLLGVLGERSEVRFVHVDGHRRT